ncbi:Conserved oligomeric Golgi complex subunit 5 [Pleurotus pulmonarius]
MAALKPEYTVFANPEFDPNEFANSILSGDALKSQAEPPAKEDISEAIAKLDAGVDDVSKQIKGLVTDHHQELLAQVARANDLGSSITSVRSGLAELDRSMEKLTQKVRTPYTALQTHASRLQKLQTASDLLRRTSRFVILTRRLHVQMVDMSSPNKEDSASVVLEGEDEKERTIAKAALSIAELVALLDPPTASPDESSISLRSIKAVAAHIPFIEESRDKVTDEMQTMVINGLTTLDQSLLASSLQTAYNLRILPDLVQNLISDLSQAVEERIHNAFDLSRISKEVSKEPMSNNAQSPPTLYRSRVRTEPTNLTVPQYTAALWSRLENMIEEMAGCCDKVYTLEKVLKIKKDTVTHVVFLDETMKLLENTPSASFWTSLSWSLEKHARDASKNSSFLQQTLSTGYPRLLRLFHEFFAKIAVHTDTIYTHKFQSPETVLILRALSNFESLYLSRSANKLNETVGQALAGGTRNPPGVTEGTNVARAVVNELDSARFDPLLVRSVAKNAATSLDMMLTRIDPLVVRDRSAVSLVGPTASVQQITNGQIVNFLYHCWTRLQKLASEYTDSVYAILKPSIDNIQLAFQRIIDPMLIAIRREVAAIIARLHRVDLSKSIDSMTGLGGASIYMKDLVEKLAFVKAEILPTINIGEITKTWVVSIVQYVIRTFVLHVSIAKPLGESGKLQLTSDMTELEFALNALMVDRGQNKRGGDLETVGEDYRTLRALRPLLFLENTQLAEPKYTAGLPPLIVLHHILVRSPIPLPHSLHGWQEAEYVRWVDEHSDAEAWTLIESGLAHWEKISGSEGKDKAVADEYIRLARTVLSNVND